MDLAKIANIVPKENTKILRIVNGYRELHDMGTGQGKICMCAHFELSSGSCDFSARTK